MDKNINTYECFYRGQQKTVLAETTFAAQKAAAILFKAKKSFEINVVLAAKGGESVVHVAQN